MLFLSHALNKLHDFSQLERDIKANRTPVACFGLGYVHRLIFAKTLCEQTGLKGMLVLPSDQEAAKMQEDLCGLGLKVLKFPSRDYSPVAIARSNEFEHIRIGTLSAVADGAFDMLITTPSAVIGKTIPKQELLNLRFTLKVGQEISLDTLSKKLIDAGYTRCPEVSSTGQFSIRGSIVDIFSPCNEAPYRIDFWGDEIDSIYEFDILTQRRNDSHQELTVVPANEVCISDKLKLAKKLREKIEKGNLSDQRKQRISSDIELLEAGISLPADRYFDELYPTPETLFDYFSGVVFICDSAKLNEALDGIDQLSRNDLEELTKEGFADKDTKSFYISKDEFSKKLSKGRTVFFDSIARTAYPVDIKSVYSFTLKQLSPCATFSAIAEDILPSPDSLTVILAGEKRTAESLTTYLNEHEINARFVQSTEIEERGVFVVCGLLSSGFEIPSLKFCLLAYGKATSSIKRRRFKKGADIGSLEELKLGDLVVHNVHGIGVFDGITQINTKGISQDYIKIKYRGSDVLYVPVTSLDMVSRYIGAAEDSGVKLNKLGSSEWSNTRSRVRSAVKDIAKQLTELYAKRMQSKGFAFSEDNDMQRDFEQRFAYDETDDQLRCIEEIKRDMQASVPMDRLLCGDVGFGKTEVALRAAFKCILDGKQCAVLVPTTILAWQHFATACERFAGMAVNVEMISRFRTPKQQEKIKKQLSSGLVDLIVGTHRLISKDMKFKDLGLLIIDEEHRFGVAQKEKLKEIFPSVDVLTLSATPIPRTLNMALSGLRDMSSIEEAPHDRMPVQSYVIEHDNAVINEAISKELHRGGQVYYLHNRTESINSVAARLQQRFPEYSVGVAHGKMGEEELSSVWQQLIDGDINILVCTTIIETGVDVPNANTLIIEDADRFGLSELHQLRGRVGRSHRRAFAYFLFKRGKALSDISQKRLEAIREFTEFGSGYKIAMRDLELRGAGSVLGGEQHGHMESVGYDMYLRLLSDAIAEQNGTPVATVEKDCSIDIRSSARIPDTYITDLSQRLAIYRKIAAIRTQDDILDVTDELIDRFGEPPKQVMQLMDISLIKATCINLGFCDVSERNSRLALCANELDQKMLLALYQAFSKRIEVVNSEKKCIYIKLSEAENPFELLKSVLNCIETFTDSQNDEEL